MNMNMNDVLSLRIISDLEGQTLEISLPQSEVEDIRNCARIAGVPTSQVVVPPETISAIHFAGVLSPEAVSSGLALIGGLAGLAKVLEVFVYRHKNRKLQVVHNGTSITIEGEPIRRSKKTVLELLERLVANKP